MKTLKDHTIIYDDECPMCTAYTSSFVKTGMLDEKGREAFTDVAGTMNSVDWTRARNEIAMVNRKDQTVLYGVEAIAAILVNRFPPLKYFTGFPPLMWLLKRLYFFISYNRKVIAPGKVFEAIHSCKPDVNYVYRWAYIMFAWLVTSLILVRYSILAAPLVPVSDFAREFLVCGGQILFQGVIVLALNKGRAIHYLGNLMTVSLGGALLLTPMFLLSAFITEPLFYIVYFMLVVSIMFFEHMRRVRILELPWILCFTWVLYRFIALYFIL
jgi:predicted DCC family thiol-disulfide oxidoreductase YuxK